MSEALSCRSAQPSEREPVVAMLGQQLDEHGIVVADLAAAVGAVLADASLGRVLVAARGAKLVGVAYISFTFTLEHGGKVAWLEELYVLPHERGRGVGSALLGEVIATAEAAGCRAIDLEVDTSHARAARLYERRGFRALERRRFSLAVTADR